ncbi:MAG: hypothetical protein GY763_07975 [Gammaproteobacteria bacterium]|nr:hypothetical protein [Gammaproteobacteria bacterium]
MKNKFFSLTLIIYLALPVHANSLRIFTLSADEWARPRAGAVIADFTSLRSAVAYWETGTNHNILIRYPGEDSGEIWATELRDWLVSLGIPTDYIELVSGSQDAEEIRLIVGKRKDFQQ